jgi:hypothetical protein
VLLGAVWVIAVGVKSLLRLRSVADPKGRDEGDVGTRDEGDVGTNTTYLPTLEHRKNVGGTKLIPTGHKFRLSRQAAQLSFIPRNEHTRAILLGWPAD